MLFGCSVDPADEVLAQQWSGSKFCMGSQKYILMMCKANVGCKIWCNIFPVFGNRATLYKPEIISILKNADKECP
jgi:hypothetical protein